MACPYEDDWAAEAVEPELLDELAILNPAVTYAIKAARVTYGESMGAYLAFMSLRLVELKRIMKPAGSVYLQCDPRTSHLLRTVMDAVFGQENFKNELVFERRALRGGGRRWMWAHDTLLFYTGPKSHTWGGVRTPHEDDHWERNYKDRDCRGRYQLSPLTKAGRRYDHRDQAWGDYDPGKRGRFWAVPLRLLRLVEPDRDDLDALSAQEKLDILQKHGMIHNTGIGREPRYKLYEWAAEDAPVRDVLTDIGRIESGDVERTGWPGQAPVALLNMVLSVSTKEGDLVLDPFCGSGTTCVAAEQLGRRWIGIERDEIAIRVLSKRLRLEAGFPHELYGAGQPPMRTDYEERLDPVGTWDYLYDRQQGRCNGCEYKLPWHLLSFDRISQQEPRRPGQPGQPPAVVCGLCGDQGRERHDLPEVQTVRKRNSKQPETSLCVT